MKFLKKYYGLFQLFLYALIITGIASVLKVVLSVEYEGIIKELFCKGSLLLMVLYIGCSAYRDLEENAKEKRWLRLEILLSKGGREDKFFREHGFNSYSDKLTFVERAIAKRVSDIEDGKIID